MVCVVALLTLVGARGVQLMTRAAEMPEYYAVPSAVSGGDLPDDADARHRFTQDWYRQDEAMRTPKWELYDLGRGLIALSASLLAGVALLRLWNARDIVQLKTPRSSVWFLGLGGAIWLAQAPVEAQMLQEHFDRGYFPWWSDIIAIPTMGVTLLVVLTLPIMMILGWVIVLWRAELPANMWAWDRDRPVRAVVWTALFGVVAAVILWRLWDAVAYSYLSVPLGLIGLYLVLGARAAVVASVVRWRAPPALYGR
jgi:hypothetical protein